MVIARQVDAVPPHGWACNGHWLNRSEMALCPHTDILAHKMPQNARMAGLTGRTAAF
jgi:hypothetical protein